MQYWLLGQPPQSTSCPQPLLMDPQAVPGPELHSGGAQHCPPSQSSLPGQLPQFRGVPQPSPLKPHSTPRSSQLSGEQQLLKRQTSSSGQDPQGIVPPQPSGASPHSPSPHAATSRGVHKEQTLAVPVVPPPPPQTSPLMQGELPQSACPPHSFDTLPQLRPPGQATGLQQ